MRFVLFCHSLVSDWNHGNAHFLRGIITELLARGHDVDVYEPRDGWSLKNLTQEFGDAPLAEFAATFPELRSTAYDPSTLDLDSVLADADVVIVHEWNDHDLVSRIGRHRAASGDYKLLFHDTHHRSATDPAAMAQYDLSNYDGVLAFGRVIRDLCLENGWTTRAWTWHEAADDRLFRPRTPSGRDGDLVWVGNWGDGERSAEIHEFLLEPVRRLGLKARVHGVRYPDKGKLALADAGIQYAGWLPNFRVPEVFSRFQVTVHIPRRPYREQLPGIPTIRVFEALACGIPLISAPWEDAEGLFSPGEDFLVARDSEEMVQHLTFLLENPLRAVELATHGRRTILERHTCAHRIDELLEICRELGAEVSEPETEQRLRAESQKAAVATRN